MHSPRQPEDEYLTRSEAASILRIRPRTLADWQREGRGPPAITVSRLVTLYSKAALAAFLQSRS